MGGGEQNLQGTFFGDSTFLAEMVKKAFVHPIPPPQQKNPVPLPAIYIQQKMKADGHAGGRGSWWVREAA